MPKVHRCPHCSREFKRPEHLRRHCRAHTGEKPYVCHCGACFTRKDLLRRHEGLAHTDDSEDPLHLISASSSRTMGLVNFPANVERNDQAGTDIGKQAAEGCSRNTSWQPSSQNCM
ncbi:uncharacterized protein B0I36DRAFT_255009 [Microdochium trichocladiopsis]|uniref:C2H2-type domain-containing protein n=1 Tax=Microdochium trichocladiopsis TaxID=1682393 RepID=A0A9P8XWV5_9PEZI|nr:uncharacterized protein B0I36DRAFT_255009 [Microdochium trichocladiopsis]KAH7016566.1 hypothetical protein B0I36DRAFT_255009 [Microdochium trichocladiopsis]